MSAIDDLKTEVAAAVTTMNNAAAALAAASDATDLVALRDQLAAAQTALDAALAAKST